jgi:hypothetical protein
MTTIYLPPPEAVRDLANRFVYHPPMGDQAQRYQRIREAAGELAELLSTLCPPSRELSLSITNLEQASMWANAAIARNERLGVFEPGTEYRASL